MSRSFHTAARVDELATPREDRVRRVWMRAKFEHLDKLLRDELGQAEAEIAKHLHGELTE